MSGTHKVALLIRSMTGTELWVRVDAFVIYNILEGEVRTEKTSLLLLLLV